MKKPRSFVFLFVAMFIFMVTTVNEAFAFGIDYSLDDLLGGIISDDEVSESDFLCRQADDGTVEICLYTGNAKNLVIPSEIDGKCVSAIREHAFMDTNSLGSVIIPEGVRLVGDGAFARCKNLESVVIPDSMEAIDSNPFINCDVLKDIVVSPENEIFAIIDGVLFDKSEKRLVAYPCGVETEEYAIPQGIDIIGKNAFYFADLCEIIIPDSVIAIGENAFACCAKLKSVTIPNSVIGIGNEAFTGCNSLEEIILSINMERMGDYAFMNCTALNTIELPDRLTSIGKNPFIGCENLMNITVGNANKEYEVIEGVLYSIKDDKLITYPIAFPNAEYVIKDNTKTVGDSAFYGCTTIERVILPKSTITVENCAFANCANVVIDLPQSIGDIGDYAFFGCEELRELVIPPSVKAIGDGAFLGCTKLLNLNIPKSVEYIGYCALGYPGDISLTVERDSYAAMYAKENELDYAYPDMNDWLND